ncbi:hypothetical protein MHLP_04105 [Candidatus Mycoplasma haematolamae str. Purdue]|uniref:Uncharacterized protein n=1 Tax=Mycoplasma haematolamae (strain Purdue) TaxID=1212765 RepID=I7CGL0_MYCHA|nr:hypothetical protein [Candidatus Mycoplasma haematolamae]AFO52401.1 hypothetical protein MHLP_04105 [Candidatus Mycoplasma haematolamae str. Purdue]
MKIIACVVVGGNALGWSAYGIHKTVEQPIYEWGKTYCLKEGQRPCVFLGPNEKEGFMTKGSWFGDVNASTGDRVFVAKSDFSYEWIKDDLKKIFGKFPGLQQFIEKNMEDFASKKCQYKDHYGGQGHTSFWYEVICEEGLPKGRHNP